MKITEWAVDRVQVTWMALLLIVVAGALAYISLPKAEDPGFTLRIASVSTVLPGASPRRVEQTVTAPIEEALQEIPEVTGISSVSRSGLSIVTIEIDETIDDLDPVFADVRDAVDEAQADLPAEVLESRINTDVARVYGVVLALTTEGFPHDELIEAAETVKEELLLVSDASDIEIFGEQERQIVLEFNHARLAQVGLSPEALIGVLKGANITSPGGEIRVGGETIALQPSGSFQSVDDVRGLTVAIPGGTLMRLEDLVTVSEALEYPSAPWAFYNNQPAVFIGISQRDGGNSDRFGAEIRAHTELVQATLPVGLELHELVFQPDDVSTRIDQFSGSLLQSVGIVFVVIFLFLGLRTGLVVASIIPVVIAATFWLMSIFSVGIDQMSLAALLLALGMLVDNAIVMSESTTVLVQQGKTTRQAVIIAAGELWVPLLVSSLTTCAAFLPVYLAPGNASEFVGPIFKVVTMALLASWVLALTVLPALCVPFFRVEAQPDTDPYDTPFYARFRRILRASVRWRWRTLGAAVAALIGTLMLFGEVDSEFFAPSDNPVFTADITLPDSITGDEARDARQKLERWIDETASASDIRPQGIVSYGLMQGDKLPRFNLGYSGPDKATGSIALLARTSDRQAVDVLIPELSTWVEENLVGARVSGSPIVMGPGGGADIALTMSSRDEPRLMAAVEQVSAQLRSIDGVRNIQSDWGSPIKTLEVAVDPVRLRLAGLTNQNVATSLLTALSGVEASELISGDDRTPIVLRSAGTRELDLGRLRNLTVFGSSGSVSLQQIASVSLDFDYGQIRREDRVRTVQVSAGVQPGVIPGEVQAAMLDWGASADLGVALTGAGEQAESSEAMGKLLSTAPIAALVIAMLLMIQFNSLRRMLVNLAVLPFSFIGVILALLLLDAAFGFIALLAMISLFGILLNNGIVLIDRIDSECAAGRPPQEAVVEASVARLRPIMLTTITTTAGLIPLYLGGGSTFEGMAVTLMGGLAGGTVLTLVLVPVCYAIAFRLPYTIEPAEA